MENVIHFFMNTLSGPSYIIYVIVLVILIFACIGYIAENKINQAKENEKLKGIAKPGEVVKSLEVTAPIPVENIKTVEEINNNVQIPQNDVSSSSTVFYNQPLPVINPIPQVTQEPVQTVNPIPQVVQDNSQTINPVPEQKTN